MNALTTCTACGESMLFDEAEWRNDHPYHAGCAPVPAPATAAPPAEVQDLAAEVLRLDGEAKPGPWTEHHKCSLCNGRGTYTPHCYKCDDSGEDHDDCPDERPCSARRNADDSLIALYRTAAPRLARAVLGEGEAAALDPYEQCARFIEEQAGRYPADIFPEDSKTPDAIAAKMARHLCRVLAEQVRVMGAPGTAPPTEPAGGALTVRPIEIRNAVTRYAERRHMLRFSASDDGGSHFTVQWADLGAARFPYSLAGLCDACGWIDGLLLRDVGARDPATREALILELSAPLSPAAKVRILDAWHGEVPMGPADVLEYMADLAALLPYQRSEHSAKPDLSLGVSAEAYALVRGIPGVVDLTEIGTGPHEVWARIGVLGVGATEPTGKEEV